MRSTFNNAAGNSLGSDGPTYGQAAHDLPPEFGGPGITYVDISSTRPLPQIVLRGMGWQESTWKQFDGTDGTYACTLVSLDCGYGVMQMTSCMDTGCGWFEPERAAGEPAYNLGVGTNFLFAGAFSGYARIAASEGVEVSLRPSPTHFVFLPVAFKHSGRWSTGDAYEVIDNGGFEEFVNGRPRYWQVSSSDGYPLADGTWFYEGHYGAYLGGYDYANDQLRQIFALPDNAWSVRLTYVWSMRSEEGSTVPYDHLWVRLRDRSGNEIALLDWKDNTSAQDAWCSEEIWYSDFEGYQGQTVYLSFEVDTDVSLPTAFL